MKTVVSQKAVSNLTKMIQSPFVYFKKENTIVNKCSVEWDRMSCFKDESVENIRSKFALRQDKSLVAKCMHGNFDT